MGTPYVLHLEPMNSRAHTLEPCKEGKGTTLWDHVTALRKTPSVGGGGGGAWGLGFRACLIKTLGPDPWTAPNPNLLCFLPCWCTVATSSGIIWTLRGCRLEV